MKRRSAAYVIVLLPVAAALLLGEAYVRNLDDAGHFTPETLRERDGFPYRPAVYARYIFPTAAHEVTLWGNRLALSEKGYRGPDFSIPKPKGTVRIVIYGGSAAFDIGAPEGEDWPRQVETRLRDAGFENAEVVNAGVPGLASADAVGRLLTEGWLLEPDVVLLYNTWNDIKHFAHPEPLLRQVRPWATDLDPRLYYQGRLDRALCETSQLYVRLRQLFWEWRLDVGLEGSRRSKDPLWEHHGITAHLRPNSHGFYDHQVAQFKLNVSAFVDLSRDIGALPVLVRQARLVRPDNNEEERRRIAYEYVSLDHDGLVAAYAAADRVLEAVSREKDVPLVDGVAAVPPDRLYLRDHVHLYVRGSTKLAAGVAERLLPLLEARELARR